MEQNYLIPFQSLSLGHEIYYKAFEEAPKPLKNSGVIVAIDIQIATTLSGETQVQTLLTLVDLPAYLNDITTPREVVPVEHLETISIEAFHGSKAPLPVSVEKEETTFETEEPSPKRIKLKDVYNLYRRKRDKVKKTSKKKTTKKKSKAKSKPYVAGKGR